MDNEGRGVGGRHRRGQGLPSAAACAEDPGGWPPPTRAIAKARACEARTRERGLAVDDATLERVTDVIMDPAYEDVGLYYTAEERDDELPIGLSEGGGRVPRRPPGDQRRRRVRVA
jgi:hypothetical protein